METSDFTNKKKALLGIGIALGFFAVGFGLTVSNGEYLTTRDGQIEKAPLTSDSERPQEIVLEYCSRALKGDADSLLDIVTEIPKTFEDYENSNIPTKEDLGKAEKFMSENPGAQMGDVSAIQHAYLKRYVLDEFPHYVAELGYEVEKIEDVKIKGPDASVRVYFKSKIGHPADEQMFFLHKSTKGWQIFMISDPYFLAPTFP